LGDLADHRPEAGIVDLRREPATGTDDVVVMGRGTSHVGVLAAGKVEPFDHAQAGQGIQGPKDRRSTDPQAPRL
jgi:hypothetical protein